jgi:hypothetical protein
MFSRLFGFCCLLCVYTQLVSLSTLTLLMNIYCHILLGVLCEYIDIDYIATNGGVASLIKTWIPDWNLNLFA